MADPHLADRSWIQCASGLPFWPLDPRPSDVQIEDIAAALSKIPRFTGHTAGDLPYTVAQHSLMVLGQVLQTESICTPDLKLWALLHDASEAYLCDLPSPLKVLPEFAAYRRAEAAIMRAVCDPRRHQVQALRIDAGPPPRSKLGS